LNFQGPIDGEDPTAVRLTGIATPSGNTDVATKAYVDSVAQGLKVKGSCVAATTASFTVANASSTTTLVLADGEGGTGGFDADANTLTIDSFVITTAMQAVGVRVMIKNGVNVNGGGVLNKWNGIYDVGVLTDSTCTLTRAADMSGDVGEFAGAFALITDGATNVGRGYVVTEPDAGDSFTMGTTSVVFTQFSSSGGGSGFDTAGEGLVNPTGSTVSLDLSTLNTELTTLSGSEIFAVHATTQKYITFTNLRNEVYADVSGGATIASNGTLTVADTYITNEMLAGSIADSKLSIISTSNKVAGAALNIAGTTAISAGTLAAGDSIIVYDADAAANREALMSDVATYVQSAANALTLGSGLSSSIQMFTSSSALGITDSNHVLFFVDLGGATSMKAGTVSVISGTPGTITFGLTGKPAANDNILVVKHKSSENHSLAVATLTTLLDGTNYNESTGVATGLMGVNSAGGTAAGDYTVFAFTGGSPSVSANNSFNLSQDTVSTTVYGTKSATTGSVNNLAIIGKDVYSAGSVSAITVATEIADVPFNTGRAVTIDLDIDGLSTGNLNDSSVFPMDETGTGSNAKVAGSALATYVQGKASALSFGSGLTAGDVFTTQSAMTITDSGHVLFFAYGNGGPIGNMDVSVLNAITDANNFTITTSGLATTGDTIKLLVIKAASASASTVAIDMQTLTHTNGTPANGEYNSSSGVVCINTHNIGLSETASDYYVFAFHSTNAARRDASFDLNANVTTTTVTGDYTGSTVQGGDTVVGKNVYTAGTNRTKNNVASPPAAVTYATGSAVTVQLDITGTTGQSAVVGADQFIFYDQSATANRKITWSEMLTKLAGSGLSVSSDQLTASGGGTTYTFDGSNNITAPGNVITLDSTLTGITSIAGTAGGSLSLLPHTTEIIEIGGTNPTIKSITNKDLILGTLDNNKDVVLKPNGTGRINIGGTAPTIYAAADESQTALIIGFDGNTNCTFTGSTTDSAVFNCHVSATDFTSTSDRRLKHDIERIASAGEKLDRIGGYTFSWNVSNALSCGCIAQEVEDVLGASAVQTVMDNKVGEKKVLQYNGVIAILVEALKDERVTVRDLKARLEALELKSGVPSKRVQHASGRKARSAPRAKRCGHADEDCDSDCSDASCASSASCASDASDSSDASSASDASHSSVASGTRSKRRSARK
jgi:hypothetical protein